MTLCVILETLKELPVLFQVQFLESAPLDAKPCQLTDVNKLSSAYQNSVLMPDPGLSEHFTVDKKTPLP